MCPGEEFREQGEEKDSRVRRYAGAKEPLLSYVARARPTGNSPYEHILQDLRNALLKSKICVFKIW